jgi:hypothetical protein
VVYSVAANLLLAVAATGCALLTAGGGAAVAVAGPHPATTAQTVVSGKTSIDLNAKTVKVLHAGGYGLKTTGKATLKNAKLSFPVTGGTYNQGVATVDHIGGITITKGAKSVTIKDLIIHTKTNSGSADVSGHGRVTALAIGDPSSGSGGAHWVTYSGFSVTLSKSAITMLDKKFATKDFAKHPTLGIGSSTLHFTK